MIEMRPCACGSGLGAARCCNWDPAKAASPQAGELLTSTVESAFAAHARDDVATAEKLCLQILDLSPGDSRALKLLAKLRQANLPEAAEALLRRAVAVNPDDWEATAELALLLLRRRNTFEAEIHARNAVRIAPENAQSHNLLGAVLTDSNRPQAGEYHYRRALELSDAKEPSLLANLALNLKNQGKMGEARALYRDLCASDPDNAHLLLDFAKLEEVDRQFEAASALLDRCETIDPQSPSIALERAVLFGRTRAYDKAIATLEGRAQRQDGHGLGPNELLEKGRLLDQIGRYEEAFHAYREGKTRFTALSGKSYASEAAQQQARRLRGFFTRSRLAILPRAGLGAGAQPIFIVGFPRSGTTLVEQMLSSHSAISAGDELPFVNELSNIMPRLLASPLTYPEALAELWMGDRREGLDDLRDHYLRQARRYGVIEADARWFTDKMPLNETHLGLISLVFPQSPIIHVLRHPLDVILSVFSNHLTHGFYCAYALESTAQHYALTFELIEHYKAQLSMRYLPIRYEDIVDQQKPSLERMLSFIGEPFEEQCLRFEENKRYARTASYAQVTEKLYERSRFRYLRYRRELEPVVPILQSAIERLGYTLD